MFNGKNILITGGTGSFGKEFLHYLLKNYNAKRIVIFSRDEAKHYELQKKYKNTNIRYFIGDVRDKERLLMAMNNIQIVVHSAAMKQVPLSEYNPIECIKTNINGAQNIIEACIYNNVEKVIALSTDKACNPINLYGATKLASDKLFVSANNLAGKKNTQFSVVRYGNVSGSKGSIIPVIKNILNNSKAPIELTHPDMTRFWITLNEGVRFVAKSLSIMKGGEIFIPKLNSYKVIDLIKILGGQRKIIQTGIRPGEKLHEYLFSHDEYHNVLEHNKYYIIVPQIQYSGKKIKFIKSKMTKLIKGYSSGDSKFLLNKEKLHLLLKKNNYV